ncbi:MAG: helix-turn-helix transcriptional regulator [Oscillospiraceae bacterium]|nr:helix-turn-helix transcriptional regulator [Oscillospiraceae bacterium]
MSDFLKTPNIPIPCISDYDSFIYTYKVSLRRAMSAFIDDLHYHEHIAIWYNTSGEYDMYFNGETVHCSAGTLLFMPPFAIHAMDTRNVDMASTQIISMSLPRDALYGRITPVYPLSYNSAVCGRESIPLCIKFRDDEKARMDELFNTSLFEYRKKSDMHRTRIFDNIDEIIKLIKKHSIRTYTPAAFEAAKRRSDIIGKAVKEIILNYTAPPSIEQAAMTAGMTPRGFTKLFKSITNLTYHDFATAFRATEAIKLLKYTTKSIAEIGDECGYADNSHFTRTFIKLFNSPPQRLRREMIEVAKEKEADKKHTDDLHSWESTLDKETIREHFLTSLGREYV